MSEWRVEQGDCLAVMATMDADSIDAIVCDPPYELAFMGKRWDGTGIAFQKATWAAALRVAKPGAHLVAFGGTRTHHRLMVAIEDAGWEIRDCLMWLYGSGFPKSHNLPGGIGTALKPAYEPIVLARKPLAGTVAANVARYGTGAINVDGCRLETGGALKWSAPRDMGYHGGNDTAGAVATMNEKGRWPANVCLDEDAAAALDAAVGERASGPSRFFYTAKASRSEREAGLDGRSERAGAGSLNMRSDAHAQRTGQAVTAANHHPTVKPLALMRWLVRLVTPLDGLILDSFTGSGSTGCAAVLEGFWFIGVEQDAEYCEIARRRIAHWSGQALPLFATVAD